MNSPARRSALIKDPPLRHRGRSQSTPEPAEERELTELWKAIAGEDGPRYRPLPVPPELAAIVGENKAALLVALDYWTQRATYTDRDGNRWCYNTLIEWRARLPWLHENTIKRLFQELKTTGYVFIEQFHVSRLKRENFYRPNYETLKKLRQQVADIAQESETTCATVATRRRFFGGAQSLLNGRFDVG